MAGYVIHLAVGVEYIKRHKNEIKNYKEFIEGIIYPDNVSDKSLTHYGEKSSKVHLKDFLVEHEINTSFEKGYFLHLITDYLFYNKFLDYFSKKIYDDYDMSNKYLIEKYKVKIPEEVKNKIFYKCGGTKLFTLNSISKFIEKTAQYDLEYIKTKVLSDDEFWTTIIDLEEKD